MGGGSPGTEADREGKAASDNAEEDAEVTLGRHL
jgi:hypothetical protein